VETPSQKAEWEIRGPDVVAAWNALEPVIAACAESVGTHATKSAYEVTNWDYHGTVTAPNLLDGLDHAGSPKSISVTYTPTSNSGSDPYSIEYSIELRIMREGRHFKELNVEMCVKGPADVQTLGLFEQIRTKLALAIDRLQEP
jgi:hypothetical protein